MWLGTARQSVSVIINLAVRWFNSSYEAQIRLLFQMEKRFSLFQRVHTGCGALQCALRVERKSDRSTPHRAEIKNTWSHTFTQPWLGASLSAELCTG